MANKPTPKWSIDKNNNLVPYKKKKENTMTQEAKKQTGNHNVSKSNTNNILKNKIVVTAFTATMKSTKLNVILLYMMLITLKKVLPIAYI